MDQNKKRPMKTQKAVLAAVVTVLVIIILFASRSYLINKLGISASTESGETVSVIDSAAAIAASNSALMNNVKISNEKLVLIDTTKSGYIEGILSATTSYDKVSRYVANTNLPTGCDGTATLYIKPVLGPDGQAYTGDWLTQNSNSYIVSSPVILANQQARFKVVFTPCSGGTI